MWHEARKQERRIRGLIVDYRKRAERRQYFYDKIQADPTQFLQLHGRRSKIYLDPAVAAAGDGDAIIVPWQGQQDNLIDRFDVRAHLDYIPPVTKKSNEADEESELTLEERQLNYERYRILAQNDFLNVSEDKFLHQLYLEEQFGANAQLEAERNAGKKKQKSSSGGATIGYSYDDVGDVPTSAMGPQPFGTVPPTSSIISATADKGDNTDESDSDIDMDVSIDIGKLDTAQAHELNACGRNYGMKSNDFFSHLTKDADEADALRIAREEEQEKMLLSGRKSRRERRAQKERRIANRPFSPPSYAAKEDQSKVKDKDEESDSRSPSPTEGSGDKITYITSFGGEDEMQPHSKITFNLAKPGQTLGESCINASSSAASASGSVSYAQKVKDNLDKLKLMNETAKRTRRRSSHSTSLSPSRRRSRHRSYHRRSCTRSRRRRRYYARSRSHSRSRLRSSSWQRSRSPSYKRTRKRYSQSSSRSSTSSYTSPRRRRSRSRSHSSRRSRADSNVKALSLTEKTVCVTSTTTTSSSSIATITNVPQKQVTQQQQPQQIAKGKDQAVPPVPMISYPLSTRVLSMTTASAPTITKPTPVLPQVTEPPPPPLKRYYGRKRVSATSSSSAASSDLSEGEKEDGKQKACPTLRAPRRDDSEDLDVDTASERSHRLMSSSSTGNQTGKYSSATETKGLSQASGSGRPNLRERLKRKMQNLLNRQYKADKRAEIEKTERERQMQQEREDEMRELALKLRRRRRELRHKYGTPSSGKLSDSDVESVDSEAQTRSIKTSVRRSRSCSGSRSRIRRRSRSRSRRSSSRAQRKRKSRSASRNRRQRSNSHSRWSSERKRRSVSRRRSASREHRGSRSRHSPPQSRRRHQRDLSQERNWERDRYLQQSYERKHGSGREDTHAHCSTSSGGNRGRIVISAPPKLKKLVDY